MAQYSIGFNFRATQGYVVDPINTTYFLGELYPTSKTIGSITLNAGWDGPVAARDRAATVDPRLAGSNQIDISGITRKFRVDLPISGIWGIRLGFGNLLYGRAVSFDILDSDGTTVLYSKTGLFVPPPKYADASATFRADTNDWAVNNATINVTFSGTAAYLRLKASPSAVNELNHISFTKSTVPLVNTPNTVEVVPIPSVNVIVPVTLNSPAPIGGCSVEFTTSSGTALSGIDYAPVSGTLSFAAGEITKNIVIPILS